MKAPTRYNIASRAIEDRLQRGDTPYRELHNEYIAWHMRGDWGRTARPDLLGSRITGYMGVIYMHLDVRDGVTEPLWRQYWLQGDLRRVANLARRDGYEPILRRGTLTIIDSGMARDMTNAGLRLSLQDDVRTIVRWHNYRWVAVCAGVPISVAVGVVSIVSVPQLAAVLLIVSAAFATSFATRDIAPIPGGW